MTKTYGKEEKELSHKLLKEISYKILPAKKAVNTHEKTSREHQTNQTAIC